MNQHNYDAWVYFQLHPEEEPLRPHGAPRSKGGKGTAPNLAHQWLEDERRQREEEDNRRQYEYLKQHGII